MKELIYDKLIELIEKIYINFSIQILPKKEHKFLPPLLKQRLNLDIFLDYLFVLDKYKTYFHEGNIEIIKYSNYFDRECLPETINELILSGKIKEFVNFYVQKSAKSFFTEHFKISKKRYNVDFLSTFFGIRHFHLNSKSDDTLVFYTISDNILFFLKIGNHKDIYSKSLLKDFITEFPNIAEKNGIYELKGILPGKELSADETKKIWISGGNTYITINEKTYFGGLNSTAKLSGKYITQLQNLIHEVEYISSFLAEDKEISIDDYEFEILKINDSDLLESIIISSKRDNKTYLLNIN